jgi:hypothetical protein
MVLSTTLEEGIAGISDELSMLWEIYVADNPANVTRDVLRLHSNLKSLVAAGAGSWGAVKTRDIATALLKKGFEERSSHHKIFYLCIDGKISGLGLALSREILSITGITIRETGEPGEGARFEMVVRKGATRWLKGLFLRLGSIEISKGTGMVAGWNEKIYFSPISTIFHPWYGWNAREMGSSSS